MCEQVRSHTCGHAHYLRGQQSGNASLIKWQKSEESELTMQISKGRIFQAKRTASAKV